MAFFLISGGGKRSLLESPDAASAKTWAAHNGLGVDPALEELVPGSAGQGNSPSPDQKAAESLRQSFRGIGLSESAAALAARGRGESWSYGAGAQRGTVAEIPVVTLTESAGQPIADRLRIFRSLGLSESAARLAAGLK